MSKALKKVREEPSGYLREEHSGRGNRKCKGPAFKKFIVCTANV